MRLLSMCVCLIVISGTPTPQAHPDFSGMWSLDRASDAPPGVARELTVRQVAERTTSVRGVPEERASITIQRRGPGGIRSDSYEIGIVGGTVSSAGPRTTHTTKWIGATLVIETGSYSGPSWDPGTFAEHHEEWSLDGHGRLVIVVEDRASRTHPATSTWVYARRR
jgi:hypothetical protein